MTKDKAIVKQVYKRSRDESVPVLLRFQNGDLTTCHKDTTIYFPVKSSEEKTKRAVVIANGNVYSGPIGEGVSNELTDTYVCVRNKDTNKVRVIPIDQVKLVNDVYKEKEMMKFDTLTKEDSFALVMRHFGGRKDQRYLSNKQRSEVNLDVVKDQLQNTVEESSVLDTTDPLVSAEDNVDRIRPPFNKEATTLDSIFNLNDVIAEELIERLDEEASVLYSTEIDNIPISSEFLRTAMIALKNGPQSPQTFLKLKIIVYMDALQTMVKSKGKSLRRLELSQITEKVENDIRERFSDQNLKNKVRTSFSNEKAVCYYLVLAFMVSENYQLDVNVLAQELCMPKTKIVRFAQLVHATQKARTSTLTLQLPSTMKPLSFAFMGRRKNK